MKIILSFLIISIFLGFWGIFIEPYILTVKKISIIDEQLKGLKIVFASDLHYKKYENFRLKRDVKKINEQNADIIILGGDFVNGHAKGHSLQIEKIAKEFGNLKSKYGTFAVLGNHDIWQDAQLAYDSLSQNNITVLKNSSKKVNNIYIAGLEDLQTQTPDIQKTLKNTKSPIILISHSPDVIYEVPENVNLTLSGHLHGGQINLPFYGAVIVPSKYGTQFAYGLYNVKNKKLFVSRGIGTSILPIRFLCPPEIVVIEFI